MDKTADSHLVFDLPDNLVMPNFIGPTGSCKSRCRQRTVTVVSSEAAVVLMNGPRTESGNGRSRGLFYNADPLDVEQSVCRCDCRQKDCKDDGGDLGGRQRRGPLHVERLHIRRPED